MLKVIVVALIVLCSTQAHAYTWINMTSDNSGYVMQDGKTEWFTISD